MVSELIYEAAHRRVERREWKSISERGRAVVDSSPAEGGAAICRRTLRRADELRAH